MRRLWLCIAFVFAGALGFRVSTPELRGQEIQGTGDIAVVVNVDNPISDISLATLRKVALGDMTFWKNHARVILVLRPEGTRRLDLGRGSNGPGRAPALRQGPAGAPGGPHPARRPALHPRPAFRGAELRSGSTRSVPAGGTRHAGDRRDASRRARRRAGPARRRPAEIGRAHV